MITFKVSKTIGEEKEIIDFMPQVIGWGKWKNPDNPIECKYETDENGNKIINNVGEVSVKITKTVNLNYEDGNGNPHSIQLKEGTYHSIPPLLIEEVE